MFEPRSETFPSFSLRLLTTTPSIHSHLRLSRIFAVSLHEGICFSVLHFCGVSGVGVGVGFRFLYLAIIMLKFVQQHFGRMLLEKTTA